MRLYPTLLKGSFVAASLGLGAVLGRDSGSVISGLIVGLLAAILLFLFEDQVKKAKPFEVFCALAGMLLFVAVGRFIWPVTGLEGFPVSASLLYLLLLSGLGFVSGAASAQAFRGAKSAQGGESVLKLLDTSAIIDGRVVELAQLGFLQGPLCIPRFVLQEAQLVADSTDPARRARGRRGLATAERLQALEGIEVVVSEEDFSSDGAVDAKLVAFAKAKRGHLVTTDFNLAKVAELQGVRVLNIHQLSQALRPVVLAGDRVRVTIQKEGREPGQGVGFLEDGTMLVLENGSSHLEKTLEVTIVSVLQTSAGRLAFARLSEEVSQLAGASKPHKGRG